MSTDILNQAIALIRSGDHAAATGIGLEAFTRKYDPYWDVPLWNRCRGK